MAERKKQVSNLIYGEDLTDNIKVDANAIINALKDGEIKNRKEIKEVETVEAEYVIPVKNDLTRADKVRLEDAGFAFEVDGEAKYVVRGFETSTLLAELDRRCKGYEKSWGNMAALIEKGPY